ncbi:5-(carboxyamino)imidazole ribonucleotide synthase [Erythrobacter arachoides]|uniref:N5-carboxyaminoimidazole ribonucleotide synthase n=1 Tax=Aurantiacibacter arachoides TaxID=1850444 RepID=A0A845A2F9_9SPHN|nr:5-(carboxyamino)imidazole ribonucleotide synthase [Aurantiacibacter arachoides]MXO94721.1 5-(carboxyamino)imidazole ribonucleotide synthase [Aurantiacibacter arachoides]GGD61173.1 N5-carboxyaminoimidazole ribonucleotide synthase [Aurantiacibacter arachoides]
MTALAPGSTIGILGGGQLGRMLAVAAAQLGYRCHVYSPESDSVAAEVAARFTCAAWHDAAALAQFAAACDVITYEFENVPVGPLGALPHGLLAPGTRALEVAQDRVREKHFVEDVGGTPAPYAAVDHDSELAGAVDRIGTPGILKTRRDGYDGKGQWRFENAAEAQGIRIPQSGSVYEGMVRFEREFSVILVRGHDGEVRFWDSPVNTHRDGILARSELPAPAIVTEQVAAARALAQRVAEALGYVGVMTAEFFATADGPVFNEMAPRVHNSGHWTIEGAVTSQFENHVRAICGLPLGDTASLSGRMVMQNLIGEECLAIEQHLSDPAAHLHLYGKAEPRPGRKMGHLTRVG